MGATVNVTVTGNSEAIAKLTSLGAEMLNVEEELAAVGDYLAKWFPGAPFASEGQVYGTPWDRLSPGYEARKANTYRGRTILIASGDMQRSFFFETGPGFVTIGNRSSLFPFHQLGTSKMPARVSMRLSPANTPAIAAIFEEGIARKLEKL